VDGFTEVKHCIFVIGLFFLRTYLCIYDCVHTMKSNFTSLINITNVDITYYY
jgi:hypothetical protein